MHDGVAESVGHQATNHFERSSLIGDARLEAQRIEDRQEIFAALRQSKQHQRFLSEFGKADAGRSRQPMARRQHGMQWDLAQRLEQDVGAKIEVIGQRHLALAVAQAGQHTLHMRFMQPDLDVGKLAGKSAQQARDDPRCKGDKAAEIELAREPATEIQSGEAKLVGMGNQLARLAEQPPPGSGQRKALGMVAQEQLDPEPAFQLGNRRRNRRLRDIELARRTGDAAGIGRRNEISQMLERKQVRKILSSSSINNIFPHLGIRSSCRSPLTRGTA